MQARHATADQQLKNKILADIQQQQRHPYQQQRPNENVQPLPHSRSISPIGTADGEADPAQTFIFSLLPPEEKKRFMDFLIDNQVEFQQDRADGGYVATIKILNQ